MYLKPVQMIRSKCQTCFNYIADGRAGDPMWGRMLAVHMNTTGHRFSMERYVQLVPVAPDVIKLPPLELFEHVDTSCMECRAINRRVIPPDSFRILQLLVTRSDQPVHGVCIYCLSPLGYDL